MNPLHVKSDVVSRVLQIGLEFSMLGKIKLQPVGLGEKDAKEYRKWSQLRPVLKQMLIRAHALQARTTDPDLSAATEDHAAVENDDEDHAQQDEDQHDPLAICVTLAKDKNLCSKIALFYQENDFDMDECTVQHVKAHHVAASKIGVSSRKAVKALLADGAWKDVTVAALLGRVVAPTVHDVLHPQHYELVSCLQAYVAGDVEGFGIGRVDVSAAVKAKFMAKEPAATERLLKLLASEMWLSVDKSLQQVRVIYTTLCLAEAACELVNMCLMLLQQV